MRVYLGDMDYLGAPGDMSVIPLNVGYVGAYLKKRMPDVSLEIFKYPRMLLDRIISEPPDVLALSLYKWNQNLNYAVMKRAKEARSETVIVMGGPNFDECSPDWMERFFKHKPQLELFIAGPGEWSFVQFIKLLDVHGCEVNRIPPEEWPPSFYGFDHDRNLIVHNPCTSAQEVDLAEIPSPYLTGLLDQFLEDENLHPIIETNRGCPYSCTFCSWGSDEKSKIYKFPLERVLNEIRYIAQRSRHSNRQLYIADANFGIFKRDMDISKEIRKCLDKYGFPKYTYAYFAKSLNRFVINVAANLGSVVEMSMSKQSLNETTLKLIKRRNISNEKYDELRLECGKRGVQTFCELIYGLPGESYDSFIKGVVSVLRSKQIVTLYPFMMDAGSESATISYRRKCGIRTAFRVLPKRVGSYGDLHSMEYEEIVIANNAMSREDYIRIRMFHLMIFVLNIEVFRELRQGLEACDLDLGTLSQRIIEGEKSWTPILRKNLEAFYQDCQKELLSEDQVKYEFTNKDIENVKKYELALNPLFISRLVSSHEAIADFRVYLLDAIRSFFGSCLNDEDLQDLNRSLELSIDRMVCYENLEKKKIVGYDYDIDAWLNSEKSLPLRAFRQVTPVGYTLLLGDDIIPAFQQAIRWATDVVQAVYFLRMHSLFSATADRMFSYKRVLTGI